MNVVESKEYVKIQFYEQDVGYENLLATRLKDGLFRIESIPFFVYDVSLHDVINAKPDQEGRLQFLRVVSSSGNRTLRARKSPEFSTSESSSLVEQLKACGCQAEILNARLIAIDVPEHSDLRAVTNLLSEHGLAWEYAKPSAENK